MTPLTKLRLKLSVLDNSMTSVSAKISEYLAATESFNTTTVLERNTYKDSFNELSYNVLSSSPFISLQHVCKFLNCNPDTLKKWRRDNSQFNDNIVKGLTESEVLSRDLILECSFEPASKVNTALIQLLSENVHKIKSGLNISIEDEEIDNLTYITDSISEKEAAQLYSETIKRKIG